VEKTVPEARLNNSRSFWKGILNSALEFRGWMQNVNYVEGHCVCVCGGGGCI